MSSRGYLVDLIESIGEKTALASHIREKIEAGKDVENNREILKKVLALRREQMSYLMSQVDEPNPDYWCDFKHAVKSWIQDSEVYEATLTEETEHLMIKSSEILAMEISSILGMEFEVCARCIFDRLLVNQIEKQQSAILKANDKGDE